MADKKNPAVEESHPEAAPSGRGRYVMTTDHGDRVRGEVVSMSADDPRVLAGVASPEAPDAEPTNAS